ncbi:MAG TPA: hypothetical protein VHO72_01640 [Bacteroidales bacterium]|nr:hypothetical protein [Bacteroidales bacterium]
MAKETIEKILTELENVKTTIHKVNNTGKFPDIEKDIVLSKLRNIYEFINYIQPITQTATVSEEIVSTGPEFEESKKKIEIIEKPADKDEILEIKVESTTKIKEETSAKHGKEEILAEKLKETGEFMNEVLARYANTFDLSKKMQSQPVSDIATVIGLNDKFLFTKELFNNDTDLYNQTINKLNKANDFNNAIQYIDSNFKWDFEDPAVQKFLELIRRRFPAS